MIQTQCGDIVFPPLVAAASQGRPPLGEQNKALIGDLQDVSAACSKLDITPPASGSDTSTKPQDIPTDDDVTKACQGFKDAANKAQPPTGEAETGAIAAKDKASDSIVNPYTAPAK